jgi:hypothetical protein
MVVNLGERVGPNLEVSRMWFDAQTAKTYSRAAEYVQKSLQPDKLKLSAPKTWSAYLKACEDDKLARQALTWSSGPRVVVIQGMIQVPGRSTTACGLYPNIGAVSDVIWITSVLMNAYQKCSYEGDVIKNARRVEVTLLHECVHWVRQKANNTDLIFLNDDLPGHEAGELFEQWAYGKLFCNQDDLWDAMLSYR